MKSEIAKTEIGYCSHDGKTQIHALLWLPQGAVTVAPRGIVQLVHGLAEHVKRYDEFACFLAQCGFVVCANDHIGHGKSVSETDGRGCLPADDGASILVEDVHELRKLIAGRYAQQTPYFLFGHSMGSFIVRVYLSRHAEGLTGAIICGTAQQPALVSAAGHWLAGMIARSKGADYRSDFLDKMGVGSYSKAIHDARTSFDWLSTDPAVVDAYITDEACGFKLSAGGYAALTSLTGEMVSKECVSRVPHDLPLLFIAGAADPVGSCGKGVRAAAEQLQSAGVAHLDCKLYDGMRHEILNEPDHAQVFDDIASWLEKQLQARTK
ncbi:MAG: alpha/beta fold hydrolase [Raoultibacter sp.]